MNRTVRIILRLVGLVLIITGLVAHLPVGWSIGAIGLGCIGFIVAGGGGG